jgi:hypothetical protein
MKLKHVVVFPVFFVCIGFLVWGNTVFAQTTVEYTNTQTQEPCPPLPGFGGPDPIFWIAAYNNTFDPSTGFIALAGLTDRHNASSSVSPCPIFSVYTGLISSDGTTYDGVDAYLGVSSATIQYGCHRNDDPTTTPSGSLKLLSVDRNRVRKYLLTMSFPYCDKYNAGIPIVIGTASATTTQLLSIIPSQGSDNASSGGLHAGTVRSHGGTTTVADEQ